jgi:triosephosphate isomerase
MRPSCSVFCIGETKEERFAHQTNQVLKTQLKNALAHLELEKSDPTKFLVAYEPIWAIGTGEVATPKQAQEAHAYIRECISELISKEWANQLRILYGGSVKPDNSHALLSEKDVDGGLIGGASLKTEDFISICQAAN